MKPGEKNISCTPFYGIGGVYLNDVNHTPFGCETTGNKQVYQNIK